jgi:hypothetical protein
MLVMNIQEIRESHVTALYELYKRIAEIAESMGGRATAGSASRRRAIDVAEPRDENVPALFIEMPDGFYVDFAPPDVLRPGALAVHARRVHRGGTKNPWMFNFLQGTWRTGQSDLSDEEIRKCLTPEGRPAVLGMWAFWKASGIPRSRKGMCSRF